MKQFYLIVCRKNSESKNPKVVRTKNEKIMLLSKFSVYYSKKSKLFIDQKARGLLNKWTGLKIPILRIVLVGH